MLTPFLVGMLVRESRGGLFLGGHQGIYVFRERDEGRAWEKGSIGKPRTVE